MTVGKEKLPTVSSKNIGFSKKRNVNITKIPSEVLRWGLAAFPEDDKPALNDFGIDFAAAQCKALLAAGVVGLHFYTMDRSSSTVGIVKRLRAEGLL